MKACLAVVPEQAMDRNPAMAHVLAFGAVWVLEYCRRSQVVYWKLR